jgi:methionyl-tRNA formyltransferase
MPSPADPPRVIVFGYDQLMLTSLDALSEAGAEVIAAVFPRVRQDPRANAIREEVSSRGMETIEQPRKGEIDRFVASINALRPDVIFVWSYPMILSRELIEIPPLGCINLHMGLLPQYRGVNGLKWALLNGETQTGVTLHYIDEGIDTGDMISRVSFPIGDEDDIVSLMKKARFAGIHLMKNIWPQLVEGTVRAMPQNEADAGYYSAAMEPPREIDWSRSAREIHNRIRASARPFEGVYTLWGAKQMVLRRSEPDDLPADKIPGTVLAVGDDGFTVATGAGRLVVKEVEVDGITIPESGPLGIKPGSRLA